MTEWLQGPYFPEPIIPETTGRHPSDKVIRNPLVRLLSRLPEKIQNEMYRVLMEEKRKRETKEE